MKTCHILGHGSMKWIVVSTASGLLLLNACGGGGGSGGPPIVSINEMVSASLKQEQSGPTASEVVSYLRVHISGGPWPAVGGPLQHDPGLARFAEAPVIRVAEGTSDNDRALVHRTVALINRELPYDLHLRIGDDAPALAAIEDVPDNHVYIDIAPAADWNVPNFREGSGGIAELDTVQEYDRTQERWEKKSQRAAHIWIESATWPDRSDDNRLNVLIHEVLHTLGLHGHVEPEQFPDAILAWGGSASTKRLPEIEGAALRAIYTRFDNGTEPEDLSIASLGPWDRTTTSLTAEIGNVSFGVRHRDGVSIPWDDGDVPSVALADNRRLSGTATWKGQLWGFTPLLSTVGGDAELGINLSTLAGRADFTELQEWPKGETPAAGTGAQWLDGDLGYTITVSGNYLRSTGGDDGVLSAAFYGPSHEGVAGSVERSDLTAAFGGTR